MLPPPNPSGSGGSISSGSNSQNNNSSGNGLPPRRTPLSATSSLSTIYTSSNYTSSSSESVPTRSNPVAGPSRYTGDRHAARNIEGYGEAMKITGGCLSGKKVKFSLTMAQEPVHGRRRTEKDRRPLAHCPILRLKMKQMDMEGMEDEIDVGSFEPGCFVCAAELFEVDPSQPSSSSSRPSTSDIPQTVSSSSRSTSLSSTSTARQPSAVPHPLVMATRRPSTREMAQNTADVSIDNPPRPPPAPPHRAASWAADGPAGMAGMSAAARMRAEADFPLAPPRRPSIPSTPIATDSQTSSGSATPHPSSISPLNHDPSIARPVYTPDQHSESLRTSHLGHIEQNPRPGIQRTSGARSSGSSGDGDPTTAKPSSKRAKQTNEEDDDESGPSVDPSYHSSRRPGGMSAQRNLFGCLHVPAVRVIAPEGGLGLWFLFTDLTVRLEGTFALRFKVFDVTAADKTSKAPILVEAISQSFKVYSPRNFPGLPKPTELAEHFGRQGFKLNTRKNERQVKTPPPEPTPAAPTPTQTTQKQNPPQRPEARPVQSSSPESRIDNPPHFSSSSEHSDRRPETAGTQTTNNTATTTSFYSTDWDEGSMGTNTTSTSNLSGTGSKSKVAPSPLSRSFDEKM